MAAVNAALPDALIRADHWLVRSSRPVGLNDIEAKKGEDVLWWRYPQSAKAIRDDRERDKIIASRWGR